MKVEDIELLIYFVKFYCCCKFYKCKDGISIVVNVKGYLYSLVLFF